MSRYFSKSQQTIPSNSIVSNSLDFSHTTNHSVSGPYSKQRQWPKTSMNPQIVSPTGSRSHKPTIRQNFVPPETPVIAISSHKDEISQITSSFEEDVLGNLTIDKRGKVNLNHLMNFQFPPRQSVPMNGLSNSARKKKISYFEPYNKEKFINANYRFIMEDGYDYSVNLADPDAFVNWENIVQVIMSTSKPSVCPICLCAPSAAKLTKCGHVYCSPCILHYLDLSETKWRKCPICYDSIYAKDLKSARFISILDIGTPSYSKPFSAKMYLMERKIGSAICLPKIGNLSWPLETSLPPDASNVYAFPFAKLLSASPDYILKEICNKDIEELKQLMAEDGDSLVGSIFANTKAISGVPLSKTEQSVEESHERSFIEKALILAYETRKNVTTKKAAHELFADTKSTFSQKQIDSPVEMAFPIKIASSLEASYFFYQSSDGQHLYMHPLDIKIMKYEYGDYSLFPEKIQIDIVHVSESTLNDDLRRRCKYLGHLPLSCDVSFCEVDLRGIVADATLKLFEKELKQRVDKRLQKEKKEELAKKKADPRFSQESPFEEGHKQDSVQESLSFNDSFPLISPSGSLPNASVQVPNINFAHGSPWTSNSGSFAKVAAGSSSTPLWPALPSSSSKKTVSTPKVANTAPRIAEAMNAISSEDFNEQDYIVDEDMGWTLDLEEAVLTKDSGTGIGLQPLIQARKNQKKKHLVISNSGGRGRN